MNSIIAGLLAALVVCFPVAAQRRTPPLLVSAPPPPFVYDFVELYAGPCWIFDGPDAECDQRTLRVPSYTGSAPLQAVRIHHKWHLSWALKIENLHTDFAFVPGPENAQGGFSLYTWIWSKTAAGAWVPLHTLPSVTIDECVFIGQGMTAFDGTLDYAGSSGLRSFVEWDMCLQPDYWTESVSVLDYPWHIAPFVDPSGYVDLVFRGSSFVTNVDAPLGQAGLAYELQMFWDLSITKIEYITQ